MMELLLSRRDIEPFVNCSSEAARHCRKIAQFGIGAWPVYNRNPMDDRTRLTAMVKAAG
jgi:hypothetical protein